MPFAGMEEAVLDPTDPDVCWMKLKVGLRTHTPSLPTQPPTYRGI